MQALIKYLIIYINYKCYWMDNYLTGSEHYVSFTMTRSCLLYVYCISKGIPKAKDSTMHRTIYEEMHFVPKLQ
jgi:hypothetical protein